MMRPTSADLVRPEGLKYTPYSIRGATLFAYIGGSHRIQTRITLIRIQRHYSIMLMTRIFYHTLSCVKCVANQIDETHIQK